jgi:hypothetical protein
MEVKNALLVVGWLGSSGYQTVVNEQAKDKAQAAREAKNAIQQEVARVGKKIPK